ncbi:MAG: 5-(carboxyamino)imidazole ribonucleotide mutase [Chloroflexi bacterium]|nr:5-(carboxyamino)imidazole ribonucleotide mutase [Chloroflexota bacterium]MCH2308629.1 5-(carboxyamino)imidazole ribonucleotide mutase [SAR202 cluster bacterium]|tara:strand:- start:7958 stop:8413 length:456 start_codon:yes stop_codon:yes gene_type:complete
MSKVGIVIGSKTDKPIIESTEKVLDNLGVEYESVVISAHRNPEKLRDWVLDAPNRGIEVFIAGAGGAAALPGAVASWTTTPVIGVPVPSSQIGGIDSLFSIVQMPPGIPVACVAVGDWGARNAAYFAAQILGIKYKEIKDANEEYRNSLKN